jgi:hypothetical protein
VRVDRQLVGNGPGTSEPQLSTRPLIIDTSGPEVTIVLEPVGELLLVPRTAESRGLRCYVDTPDGLPARSRGIYNGSPFKIGLAPGPYVLTIEDEDGVELLRRSIEIGPKPVEVEVPR